MYNYSHSLLEILADSTDEIDAYYNKNSEYVHVGVSVQTHPRFEYFRSVAGVDCFVGFAVQVSPTVSATDRTSPVLTEEMSRYFECTWTGCWYTVVVRQPKPTVMTHGMWMRDCPGTFMVIGQHFIDKLMWPLWAMPKECLLQSVLVGGLVRSGVVLHTREPKPKGIPWNGDEPWGFDYYWVPLSPEKAPGELRVCMMPEDVTEHRDASTRMIFLGPQLLSIETDVHGFRGGIEPDAVVAVRDYMGFRWMVWSARIGGWNNRIENYRAVVTYNALPAAIRRRSVPSLNERAAEALTVAGVAVPKWAVQRVGKTPPAGFSWISPSRPSVGVFVVDKDGRDKGTPADMRFPDYHQASNRMYLDRLAALSHTWDGHILSAETKKTVYDACVIEAEAALILEVNS